MKPSKMTNERIAEELIETIPHLSDEALSCTDADDILREAASRLLKIDIIIVAQKAKTAAEGYAHGCEGVAGLRIRLKVAEDALQNLQERLVSSVYDGTIDTHEALKIAEDAIAAISEEGCAK